MQVPFLVAIAFLIFWLWIISKDKEDKDDKWLDNKIKQLLQDDNINMKTKSDLIEKYKPPKRFNPLGDFADKHNLKRDTIYIIVTFIIIAIIAMIFSS